MGRHLPLNHFQMGRVPKAVPGLAKGQLQSSKGRYKRPFDLAVLIVSHAALAPVFLLLWALIPLLIWLEDRGPVFYRQKRASKGGREVTVLKFRTMIPDADSQGRAWTVQDDPRVTKTGRFLRKTALDELPQVLSILKGDLSFVGPRALPLEEQSHLESEIPGFEERLRVRPGLTGLAQVYNRDDDARGKLRYDLEYIRRMNLILDIKLLALSLCNTILVRWDKRGAKAAG